MTNLKNLTAVTVKRSEWLTPAVRGLRQSALWREDVKAMCCLGFAMEECGVTRSEMRGWSYPYNLAGRFKQEQLIPRGGWENPEWCRKAAEINDNKEIDDGTREQELISLFAEQGIKLNFVD